MGNYKDCLYLPLFSLSLDLFLAMLLNEAVRAARSLTRHSVEVKLEGRNALMTCSRAHSIWSQNERAQVFCVQL